MVGLPFRRIVFFESGGDEENVGFVGEIEDGPADEEDVWRRSADPSDCHSIPCCCLSCAKLARRASRSSFDLSIFSG